MSQSSKLREALGAGAAGKGGKAAQNGMCGGDGVLTLSGHSAVASAEAKGVGSDSIAAAAADVKEFGDAKCQDGPAEQGSGSRDTKDGNDSSSCAVAGQQKQSQTGDGAAHAMCEDNGKLKPSQNDQETTATTTRYQHRPSVIDTVSTSSSYTDDATTKGQDPHSLYGSFTWKVPNFRDVSKRELKSSAFSVGPYKWYILVYPNGCDVSNHLSLFLCVADYDKLLPGWSHFAQFTIAVVNKDPKKSKYSDTLHRFCKKEHDWGWKKFMELGKMADGFVVGDTLVIKVQVQVIKDRQVAPFRTLDSHYRRELIRVYLSNIEGIVVRYVEDRKEYINRLVTQGMDTYWDELSDKERLKLSSIPAAPLFKLFVKKFFNEKEVTSTLMMDGAYCALKALDIVFHRRFPSDDGHGEKSAESIKETSFFGYINALKCNILLDTRRNHFIFENDALEDLQNYASKPTKLYPFDDKQSEVSSSTRSGSEEIESSREIAEKDEIRLVDLARHTIEAFAISHIAEEKIEKAWTEAEVIRRQEELIREEEEASKGEAERLAAKAEAERERRARKKERQRAKKEAERVKKEALEAEKAKEEELKRAEQERKRQEAEQKRQEEEAKKEAERQRQLELKQAAAAKKTKSKAKLQDSSHKSSDSRQSDSESIDDFSSTMTSARSDISSAKEGNKIKVASAQGEARIDVSTNESEQSHEKAMDESVLARLRDEIQRKDDEISILTAKVKSLMDELEQTKAKLASSVPQSAPTTPPKPTLGPVEDNKASTLLTQSLNQYAIHPRVPTAAIANPSDVILASAMGQRVQVAADGMKGVQHAEAHTNASRINYRVSSHSGRNSTSASRQASVASVQNRSQSLDHNPSYAGPSRPVAGYNSGSKAVLSSSKGMSYIPFPQQNASQARMHNVNGGSNYAASLNVPATSQNALENTSRMPSGREFSNRTTHADQPKVCFDASFVHGMLFYRVCPCISLPRVILLQAATQTLGSTGESSGLDDFAHLGLITDLLE